MHQRLEDFISAKGISLTGFGLTEIAFRRRDALDFITLLRDVRIPILGGDVYTYSPERLEPLYENWHTDSIQGSDFEQYVSNSYTKSRQYIESYFGDCDDETVFVIVYTAGNENS